MARVRRMPRLVLIKGCGPMVCSEYAEITAAIDHAFAGPPGKALPIGEVFASLAAGLKPLAPSRRPPAEPEMSP